MKLNEISDEEKTFLTLCGIKYDFSEYYTTSLDILHISGKSNFRRNNGRNTIGGFIEEVDIFLKQGFDDTDMDVLAARVIFNKLQEIRNKL